MRDERERCQRLLCCRVAHSSYSGSQNEGQKGREEAAEVSGAGDHQTTLATHQLAYSRPSVVVVSLQAIGSTGDAIGQWDDQPTSCAPSTRRPAGWSVETNGSGRMGIGEERESLAAALGSSGSWLAAAGGLPFTRHGGRPNDAAQLHKDPGNGPHLPGISWTQVTVYRAPSKLSPVLGRWRGLTLLVSVDNFAMGGVFGVPFGGGASDVSGRALILGGIIISAASGLMSRELLP